ncbi:MAG: hypothetical protein FWG61_00245 [Firmicutes bacterium]|nr:hypothetical protein [Bacillota bacterium]
MKKILYIGGFILLLLFSFFLAGWSGLDNTAQKALWQGNKQYFLEKYEAALTLYETGIEVKPQDKKLTFNAAQAALQIAEYEKAAQYYEKAEDTIDKYLNAGNIYYFLAKSSTDSELIKQSYAQALQIYRQGILLYPQNVPLKFNYEFVRALLDEENSSENNEQNEQDEQNEEDEQDENSEQDKNEQNEQNSTEQDQSEQEQSEENQSQEGSEQEQEDQATAEQDQNEQEDAANMQNQEEDEGEDSISSDAEENEADLEAVERILQLLESQEEESLKNNQSVIEGKDGKIDW